MPRAKSACATAGSKTMRRADRRVIPRLAPALLALALAGWAATAGAVVLTGEVRATDAQVIYTPFSNSSPVVIRFFVPEGEHVKRSEEHTSELQSLMRISYAVFCLKKKKIDTHRTQTQHLKSY